MTIEIREARPQDRLPLQRMLELYQHDLSDIWDQDIDANGEFGYALDRFREPGECKAFVACVDGHHAGFALVDRESKVGKEAWWMDQFFILKKYRRRGVGDSLARAVFAALPGRWEVGQMAKNLDAQKFWRRVVGEHTSGRYVEHELAGGWWEGVVQCFDSSLVLAGERPPGEGLALFERACACDTAGLEAEAELHYRAALLTQELDAYRRSRAVIQLASTLRILGRLEESEQLLVQELDRHLESGSERALHDEARATLALTYAAQGRAQEAAGLALCALAPRLSRYNRSVLANASRLAGKTWA